MKEIINENYNELVYRHLNIEMHKRVGDLPLVIKEVDEIKRNKKTGKIYKNEEELKAANIPEEDVQRDVTVVMPSLDVFGDVKL